MQTVCMLMLQLFIPWDHLKCHIAPPLNGRSAWMFGVNTVIKITKSLLFTWDYWLFWTLFIIWYFERTLCFRNGICFSPQVRRWEIRTLFGPLEGINLSRLNAYCLFCILLQKVISIKKEDNHTFRLVLEHGISQYHVLPNKI
jgi:hypothetical protein